MFANSDLSVPAVKYSRIVSSSIHQDMRGGPKITEIFIPSYQFSFNSETAVRATQPENKEPLYFKSNEIIKHPLTEVQLSKTLVVQILKSLELIEQIALTSKTFKANQEFRNLLGIRL